MCVQIPRGHWRQEDLQKAKGQLELSVGARSAERRKRLAAVSARLGNHNHMPGIAEGGVTFVDPEYSQRDGEPLKGTLQAL